MNNDGWKQSFQFTVGIGLNRIKGNVLVLLGMSWIIRSVKESTVGFQDVMNAISEGGYKAGAVALEGHVAVNQSPIDFGKILEGHAVVVQVGRIGELII